MDEQTFERILYIYRLLYRFRSSDPENRIIFVSGRKGSGKATIVKTATKYIIERGFFPDGVETETVC